MVAALTPRMRPLNGKRFFDSWGAFFPRWNVKPQLNRVNLNVVDEALIASVGEQRAVMADALGALTPQSDSLVVDIGGHRAALRAVLEPARDLITLLPREGYTLFCGGVPMYRYEVARSAVTTRQRRDGVTPPPAPLVRRRDGASVARTFRLAANESGQILFGRIDEFPAKAIDIAPVLTAVCSSADPIRVAEVINVRRLTEADHGYVLTPVGGVRFRIGERGSNRVFAVWTGTAYQLSVEPPAGLPPAARASGVVKPTLRSVPAPPSPPVLPASGVTHPPAQIFLRTVVPGQLFAQLGDDATSAVEIGQFVLNSRMTGSPLHILRRNCALYVRPVRGRRMLFELEPGSGVTLCFDGANVPRLYARWGPDGCQLSVELPEPAFRTPVPAAAVPIATAPPPVPPPSPAPVLATAAPVLPPEPPPAAPKDPPPQTEPTVVTFALDGHHSLIGHLDDGGSQGLNAALKVIGPSTPVRQVTIGAAKVAVTLNDDPPPPENRHRIILTPVNGTAMRYEGAIVPQLVVMFRKDNKRVETVSA